MTLYNPSPTTECCQLYLDGGGVPRLVFTLTHGAEARLQLITHHKVTVAATFKSSTIKQKFPVHHFCAVRQ